MWVAAYQLMRLVKWVFWVGFVAYAFYFVSNRAPHLTQFGHLTRTTEMLMFGLPLAGMVAGFAQLMLRDYAYPKPVLPR